MLTRKLDSARTSHVGSPYPVDVRLACEERRVDSLHSFADLYEPDSRGIEDQAVVEATAAGVVGDRGGAASMSASRWSSCLLPA
jgi:hypothetical protein